MDWRATRLRRRDPPTANPSGGDVAPARSSRSVTRAKQSLDAIGLQQLQLVVIVARPAAALGQRTRKS